MNKSDAVSAHIGQTFYHKSAINADGSARRVRVSGKCKTWKTRPTEFSLPVKFGLYTSLRINHETCEDFLTEDPGR